MTTYPTQFNPTPQNLVSLEPQPYQHFSLILQNEFKEIQSSHTAKR